METVYPLVTANAIAGHHSESVTFVLEQPFMRRSKTRPSPPGLARSSATALTYPKKTSRLTDSRPERTTADEVNTVVVLLLLKGPIAGVRALEEALLDRVVKVDAGAGAAVSVASFDASGLGGDGKGAGKLALDQRGHAVTVGRCRGPLTSSPPSFHPA
jgi:hypothetical protein